MIRQETISVIDIDVDNKFFEYMGMSIVHYLQMILPDLEEVEIRELIELGAVRISDVLIDDHEMRIFTHPDTNEFFIARKVRKNDKDNLQEG